MQLLELTKEELDALHLALSHYAVYLNRETQEDHRNYRLQKLYQQISNLLVRVYNQKKTEDGEDSNLIP